MVFAHHPLQFDAPKSGKASGIADTTDFWPLVKDRPQVKAFVFGHTHTWKLAEKDGVHLVNLPAIGYPFAKAEVTGWVDARFTADRREARGAGDRPEARQARRQGRTDVAQGVRGSVHRRGGSLPLRGGNLLCVTLLCLPVFPSPHSLSQLQIAPRVCR